LAFNLKRSSIARFVRQYIMVILLFAVLCGIGTAFGVFKVQETKYTASGFLVQNDNNYSLIVAYQQFAESSKFKSIINKQVDTSEWKNKNYKRKYQLSLSSDNSTTPFFNITATSENAKYAKYLASLSSKLFITNVGNYISNSNVSVVSVSSTANAVTSKTKIFKLGFVGFLIGALLASVIAFFNMLWVGKLRDEDYVHDIYNLRLLGTIQKNKNEEN